MYLYSAPFVQNRNTDDVSPKRCWRFAQTLLLFLPNDREKQKTIFFSPYKEERIWL